MDHKQKHIPMSGDNKCNEEKQNKGRGMKGAAILERVVKESLSKEVTLEQRSESHQDMWGKVF